ncbi:hypothetical protein Tco_1239109 [Tanacetum coccineum]
MVAAVHMLLNFDTHFATRRVHGLHLGSNRVVEFANTEDEACCIIAAMRIQYAFRHQIPVRYQLKYSTSKAKDTSSRSIAAPPQEKDHVTLRLTTSLTDPQPVSMQAVAKKIIPAASKHAEKV